MISLELAQKLKSAGLTWDFVFGSPRDCVYHKGKINEVDGPGAGDTMRLSPWQNYVKQEYLTFAPSLSQLLAEIEAQGIYPELAPEGSNPAMCKLYVCILYEYNSLLRRMVEIHKETANMPEEAAGEGLLWILEQK